MVHSHPINLDRPRNFRYGMKALSLIEKKLQKPLSKIDWDNLTMEDAAIIIWAGLVHEDKDLTPEKVMDIIDEHSDIETVFKEMSKAIQEAFGKKEGAEKNK